MNTTLLPSVSRVMVAGDAHARTGWTSNMWRHRKVTCLWLAGILSSIVVSIEKLYVER